MRVPTSVATGGFPEVSEALDKVLDGAAVFRQLATQYGADPVDPSQGEPQWTCVGTACQENSLQEIIHSTYC